MLFLCEACGWKAVSDEKNTNLTPLKNDTLSSKKYRCPGCGRALTPRNCKDPQGDLNQKIKSEQAKEDNKKWLEESLTFQKEFAERCKDDENQPS